MELMNLKMPPARARIMADAIQRDIANGAPKDKIIELRQVHAWLRYRLARWDAGHPRTPAA